VNPKDREPFWEYVAGRAPGRKASTPCNFHRKDRYHDDAFASAVFHEVLNDTPRTVHEDANRDYISIFKQQFDSGLELASGGCNFV